MDSSQLGLKVLWFNDIAKSCNMVTIVVLVYDHLLTLGLEIELVWPAPWTLGKLIYFCTTYFAWIDSFILVFVGSASISLSQCARLYKTALWLLLWGYFLAGLVLIYRTWAIWQRSKKVLICLLSLLTLFLALDASLFVLMLKGIEFIHMPASRGITCIVAKDVGQGPLGFSCCIPVVIFESIVLGLTLYKGREHFRLSRSTLALTMYRDSVLFYIYLIALTLLNMLFSMLPAHIKPGYLREIVRVLLTVWTKRMLLNLRESISRDRSKWAPATSFNNMATLEHDEGLS